MDEEEEREIHFNKRTDKTYFGRRFKDSLIGEPMRIATKVFSEGEGVVEMTLPRSFIQF